MKQLISFIAFIFALTSCKSTNKVVKDKIILWNHKDFKEDNIPGVSLQKFYGEKRNHKKPIGNVIVATIDNLIDIDHEDLKDVIWNNKKEIPNNKKDDDNNGYVDDVNGWNFLGTKSGNYIVWGNFEYTRIIREYDHLFKNKKNEEISKELIYKYDNYNKALKVYEKNLKFYTNYSKSLNYLDKIFPIAKDSLKKFFPKEDYSTKQLDSLYLKYKTNDKTFNQRRDSEDKDLASLFLFMKALKEINLFDEEKLKDKKDQIDSIANKNSNILYNERLFIDSAQNKLEKGYGNGNLNPKIKGIRSNNSHNTKVSSVIAAVRINHIGLQGFSDKIKIMPLSISPSGDEHDKDIAMAIYYAVNNGAKIINMSFAKEFSLYPELVIDALQYAEKHNVLIVHASGNDRFSSDENSVYPNDYYYDNKPEVCGNFINVGSTNKNYGKKMVSSFSNYGKKNVDLFAPGEDIYTAIPDNKYEYDSGTSLAAPMVSGTAALIWLHYPKLTAAQVKQIILDSSVKYDLEVQVPGEKEGTLKPFKELSKSGGVVNAYNALLMAKEFSKKKK